MSFAHSVASENTSAGKSRLVVTSDRSRNGSRRLSSKEKTRLQQCGPAKTRDYLMPFQHVAYEVRDVRKPFAFAGLVMFDVALARVSWCHPLPPPPLAAKHDAVCGWQGKLALGRPRGRVGSLLPRGDGGVLAFHHLSGMCMPTFLRCCLGRREQEGWWR